MTSTALVPTNGPAALAIAHELGATLGATSLDITNPDLDLDAWLNIGRAIDFVGSAWQWWVGDWLNFGEEVFGEESAQGVDGNEPFDLSRTVSRVEPTTLANIRSICARVARSRRRPELSFWMHEPVAALEPSDQEAWLQRAVDNGWRRNDLREAIRASIAPAPVDPPPPLAGPAEDGLTVAERVEAAARLCFHQAQRTSDGSAVVPAEAFAQLAAALGEE